MLHRYLRDNFHGHSIDNESFDNCAKLSCKHVKKVQKEVLNSPKKNHSKQSCCKFAERIIVDTTSAINLGDRPLSCVRTSSKCFARKRDAKQKRHEIDYSEIDEEFDRTFPEDKNDCHFCRRVPKCDEYGLPLKKKDYDNNSSNCDSECSCLLSAVRRKKAKRKVQCRKKKSCAEREAEKEKKIDKNYDYFKNDTFRKTLYNLVEDYQLRKYTKQLKALCQKNSKTCKRRNFTKALPSQSLKHFNSRLCEIQNKNVFNTRKKRETRKSQMVEKLKSESMSQLDDFRNHMHEIDCDNISSSMDTSSTLTPENNYRPDKKKAGFKAPSRTSSGNKVSFDNEERKETMKPRRCEPGSEAYEEIAVCLNGNWVTMRIVNNKPKKGKAGDDNTEQNREGNGIKPSKKASKTEQRCSSMSALEELQKQTMAMKCDCNAPKPMNSTKSCCIPGYAIGRKNKRIDHDARQLDLEGCYKTCGNNDEDVYLLQLCTKKRCNIKEHTVDMQLKAARPRPPSKIELCQRQTQIHGAKIDRAVARCRLPPSKDPCDLWPGKLTEKVYKKYLRTMRLYG